MAVSGHLSWQATPHFFDPISPNRRANPKFTGARRFPCWEIFQTITFLENLNSTQKMVWRGQENSEWSLTTSLQRFHDKTNPSVVLTPTTFRNEQSRILSAAYERGIGLTELGKWKKHHTFAELQHYEVPTHLLDVTDDALTALWFACQPSASSRGAVAGAKNDGMLFVIDVSKMLSLTTSDLDSAFMERSKSSAKAVRLVPATKPIYLESANPNKRIAAQRAAFLVPPGPTKPGEMGVENFSLSAKKSLTPKDSEEIRTGRISTGGQPRKIPFIAILIPHESKKWILNKLESGKKRSEASLFPDIPGLARKYRD